MRRLVWVLLLAMIALPASARAGADSLAVKRGRLVRWSYRAADARFSLRWTAARGAETLVAVPAVAYPRGFTVRAHGVRVVRRAPLTLRGSGRASITITRR